MRKLTIGFFAIGLIFVSVSGAWAQKDDKKIEDGKVEVDIENQKTGRILKNYLPDGSPEEGRPGNYNGEPDSTIVVPAGGTDGPLDLSETQGFLIGEQ